MFDSENEYHEDITKLFEQQSDLDNKLSRLEVLVEGLSNNFKDVMHQIRGRGQINWTMVGVLVSALTLVWTVFVGFVGVIGWMAVDSVKTSTTRNEYLIMRLQDADHLNQKSISAIEATIGGMRVETDQLRVTVKDGADRSYLNDKESLASRVNSEARIRNIERKLYGDVLDEQKN